MNNGKPKEERMAKRMLADVLRDAANSTLSPHDGTWRSLGDHFSCNAACYAASSGYSPAWDQIMVFLRGLGCETGSYRLFREFESGLERQGVRYLWLLLAACVAEDEGITV